MSARQRRKRDRRRRDAAAQSEARHRRVLAGAGITLGVGLGLASTAQAAPQTFTVGSTADTALGGACGNPSNTDCTLRDAINASNADLNPSDQDTIVFASALTGSTITLGANPPQIHQSLYIQGPGANPGDSTVTIDGNNSYRDLDAVTGGNYAMNVTVSGLNLTDGAANGGGAGIALYYAYPHTNFPEPTLTVKNSSVTGNTAGKGGGLSAVRGSITVQNSDVSNNTAGGNSAAGGGGIYLFPGYNGTLTIDNSTISGNVAHEQSTATPPAAPGGGVRSLGATTIQNSVISSNSTDGAQGFGGGVALETGLVPSTIQDSTISGNHTSGQYAAGGGLFMGAYGDTTITGSTIADNHTTGQNANGGGIAFRAPTQNPNNGTPRIQNSTIAENSTTGTGASGGGMFVRFQSDLKVANATISGNSTAGFGGGIYDYGGLVHPDITNSILSGGSAGQEGPELYSGSHTVEDTHFDMAFSLIENPTNAQIHSDPLYSNLSGVDPQLGPLQNNGGLTDTEAPALTSPVIDCGTSAGATTDQRGATFIRPIELARTDSPISGADGSDMGAFEVQSGTAGGACANVPKLPLPPQPPPESDVRKKKCKKHKKHKRSAQIAKKKCKKKRKKK